MPVAQYLGNQMLFLALDQNLVQCDMPINIALGIWKQEDQEFTVTLSYIMSSESA